MNLQLRFYRRNHGPRGRKSPSQSSSRLETPLSLVGREGHGVLEEADLPNRFFFSSKTESIGNRQPINFKPLIFPHPP
jgi:hypothetical protein